MPISEYGSGSGGGGGGTGPAGPAGPAGSDGDDGQAGDSVKLAFQRATAAPTTPATSTGSWDGATWTAPSGWTVGTIPAGSDTVYALTAQLSGDGSTINAYAVSLWQGTAGPAGAAGLQGAAGDRGAAIGIAFQRSSTTPATPATSSGAYTNGAWTTPSGWTSTIPTGNDDLYVLLARFGSTAIENYFVVQWPEQATGDPGDSIQVAFQRASSEPSTPATSTGSWDGTTWTLPSGWSATVPTGDDDLYMLIATLDGGGSTINAYAVIGFGGSEGLDDAAVERYLVSLPEVAYDDISHVTVTKEGVEGAITLTAALVLDLTTTDSWGYATNDGGSSSDSATYLEAGTIESGGTDVAPNGLIAMYYNHADGHDAVWWEHGVTPHPTHLLVNGILRRLTTISDNTATHWKNGTRKIRYEVTSAVGLLPFSDGGTAKVNLFMEDGTWAITADHTAETGGHIALDTFAAGVLGTGTVTATERTLTEEGVSFSVTQSDVTNSTTSANLAIQDTGTHVGFENALDDVTRGDTVGTDDHQLTFATEGLYFIHPEFWISQEGSNSQQRTQIVLTGAFSGTIPALVYQTSYIRSGESTASVSSGTGPYRARLHGDDHVYIPAGTTLSWSFAAETNSYTSELLNFSGDIRITRLSVTGTDLPAITSSDEGKVVGVTDTSGDGTYGLVDQSTRLVRLYSSDIDITSTHTWGRLTGTNTSGWKNYSVLLFTNPEHLATDPDKGFSPVYVPTAEILEMPVGTDGTLISGNDFAQAYWIGEDGEGFTDNWIGHDTDGYLLFMAADSDTDGGDALPLRVYGVK